MRIITTIRKVSGHVDWESDCHPCTRYDARGGYRFETGNNLAFRYSPTTQQQLTQKTSSTSGSAKLGRVVRTIFLTGVIFPMLSCRRTIQAAHQQK